MQPGHGFEPQSGEPPARLILEKTTVAPGQPVHIRIEAEEGEEFKGFIVQARDATDPDKQIGSFGGSEDVKYVNCGGGVSNSVTHTSSDPKESVEVSWIPPPDFEGKVLMKYSVVKEFTKYWVRLEAGTIRVTKARGLEEEEESGAAEVEAEAEAEAEGYAEADAEVE